ncbi:hypothetical protein SOCE26_059700 [Sorangium cellulosum]|uniref:HEAT repeat domain-containing protein n=1 Tax=Sorangium cellulosum TaxID=56 RepID=A0A2L0EZ00_SORCE|nr:hypothetical protein [Sorangium cellulosum]AUX44506.1 hypothetical protein SOCE26_059700 [Sorangium cellulosum]
MEIASFLAALELQTHHDRVRRVVELGRAAARGDAGARALLGALSGSAQPYERLLALMSVYGSEDGARVVAALSDPSRAVRGRASRMTARFCDDAQALAALDALVERRALRRVVTDLARRKRQAVVDAFLGARLANGREPTIVDLLPLGSEPLVSAHARAIEEAGGPLCLARLAGRHPEVAARWFGEPIERSRSLDVRQRYRLAPLLAPLARRAPDAALRLIQALFALGEEPSFAADALRWLVRARPRATFDLLKACHEGGRPARPPGAFEVVKLDAVAPALGAERLVYLVRHAWGALSDGKRGVRWFLRLSSGDQEAVLDAFLRGGRGGFGAFLFRYVKVASAEERAIRQQAFERWSCAAQSADGSIAPEVLDFLPRDLREREARRHLVGCPALVAKPDRRMSYARLLPFAEAKEVLAPQLGHPEGDERAKAQALLLASVLHDRGALPDALANVRARKFEQDPVRRAMIGALAALPVARFAPEHLAAVGAVVQDALDAADLSPATSSAVERLVVRLFRVDGAWGARWLAKLLAVRGAASTPGLGEGLTKAEAERLTPALAQLAGAWTTGERAGAVLWLARSLGIRLKVVVPVLEALERLSRELPFAGVAAAALHLLRQHDRPRFARLVPELLRDDRSFVLIGAVARHVSLRRQDLLDPLLESRPMTGRFATGRTHWVIDFGAGHGRWTARQQERYAAGLVALLRDETRDVPTLRFAISTLVRLAYVDASVVTPFASDPRPPLREMAVRGLPWLDAGQGVPVLIVCLGDDRARWAIYALRKAFAEMPRERVLAELRAVPTTKVTVAKEVVRLLGEMGGDDAYRDLLRLDAPGTHRDVRIALLRALWDHLDRPETWGVFERAVQDPDWIVASKLADIPLGRLSAEAERRVSGLLAAILGRAEPEARLDLLRRAAHLPLRDEGRSLFLRLLGHLDAPAPEEAAEALAAALARMQPAEVETVVRRLEGIVPKRRHLVALLSVVASRLGPYAAPHLVAVGKGLLAALKADVLAVPQYLGLAARLLDWRALAQALSDLGRRDLLHHDGMVAAMSAVHACVHPSLLEEQLRESQDPRLRRLALEALVQAASPKNGWTAERRALLERYRQDTSPAVAGPASFVMPP